MDKEQTDRILGATAQIVSAYICSHQVPAGEIPALIAAVGAALQPQSDAPLQNVITKRSYRRRVDEPEVEVRPPDAEPTEHLSIIESEPEPRRRGRRSARALIEQQAEVVVEAGVRITRLPPVIRKRRG